jgi:hypothetical protein
MPGIERNHHAHLLHQMAVSRGNTGPVDNVCYRCCIMSKPQTAIEMLEKIWIRELDSLPEKDRPEALAKKAVAASSAIDNNDSARMEYVKMLRRMHDRYPPIERIEP